MRVSFKLIYSSVFYFQVQKSVTMRKLMDAAVTRLRELKELLKEIDLSEIHYVDGSLIEWKLIPYDIEILNPALMFPRSENIQNMWERIQVKAIIIMIIRINILNHLDSIIVITFTPAYVCLK